MRITRWLTAADDIGGSHRAGPGRLTPVNEFRPGLEGVVAFQTEIAEPDREGGSLRYRDRKSVV